MMKGGGGGGGGCVCGGLCVCGGGRLCVCGGAVCVWGILENYYCSPLVASKNL